MKLDVLGLHISISLWFLVFIAVFTWRNFAELRLVRARAGGESGARTGGGTLLLFVGSYFLCGLGTAAWLLFDDPMLELFVVGNAGFLWLHVVRSRILRQELSKAWNPFTTPRTDSTLVTEGAYRRIRHPLYLLNCLELACLILVLPNPLAFAGWLIDLAASLWRIPGEERLLADRYGAAWEAYRARTWRLIPWVW